MQDEEQRRHEAECRDWIRRTNGDHNKLRAALSGIEKKRGKYEAERVRKTIWQMLKSR